jgi:hypothetical protein
MMKRWKGPEGKIGIKDLYTRRQLLLKIERTSEGMDRKAFGFEFVKRATGMFIGIWEGERLGSVEGSAPSGARKQESDVVEWSTTFEMGEEPTSITSNVSVRGARNV